MFQLEIFSLARLARPSPARKNCPGAPRWLQVRREYAVYKLCALTTRSKGRRIAAPLSSAVRHRAMNARVRVLSVDTALEDLYRQVPFSATLLRKVAGSDRRDTG